MPLALVETKFFPPRAREETVERPRLGDVLAHGSRLALVSAPAGFGKTTLVGSWLAEHSTRTGARTAWVSLDSGDREPEAFWTYVFTALDRALPGSGSPGVAALGAGQSVEVALTAVLNELSVQPDDVVLVLDDYHLADGPAIQPGMGLLLDRLPPQVRLVLSTRADPALPLARMRALGELTEIRAADLRFTDEEISTFLLASGGLSLEASEVTVLGHRTEGWIASLQLAAVSLRDREDPSAFITGFTGDDRYVVDYLVEEVLTKEPEEVHSFLLDTSVLDRLTGPLCDAVTAGTGGAQMLEALERRNLFVVPLDDQRRWYRYHHLFADVLRARLLQERPGQVAELHRRASAWFADVGEPEDAVRHALAAGDDHHAADLVERSLPDLRRDRREHLLRLWARELPEGVVRDRPVLAVGLVGGLMASNDFIDVQRRLDDVDQMLTRPRSELVAVDIEELDRLPAAMETYRAGLALVAGDLPQAITYAQRAMADARPDDDLTQAAAAGLAGLANWAMGDIKAAHTAYVASARGLARADHIADVLGCSLTIADMELALGRLGDADRTLQGALDLAGTRRTTGSGVLRGTADMLVGQSRTAWHRNDLEEAADFLRRAEALGEGAGLPQHPYRWRVALARQRAADRDYQGAVELLDDAERVYVGDFSPQVHPIHATRARVLLASGDLAGALQWARDHKVTTDDDLSYLREYEHLTLARILLAQHEVGVSDELSTANTLLDRLLAFAEAGGRLGTVLEVEILRARANHAAGAQDVALSALEHAIGLAEPDGWIRPFLDTPPALTPLLTTLAARLPSSRLVGTLLTNANTPAAAPGRSGRPVQPGSMPEPLSDRELDVLRLLASDLDGPAIAREMVVSLNTVRTHTKHIYTKLDVNNRRSAVSRAHQLGLLGQRAGR
jgi:LuxR family maltose regulon positive regulatory protein